MEEPVKSANGGNFGRLLRQPLLYFAAGAALIFLFDAVRGRSEPAGTITVSQADVARLSLEYERQWSRKPDEAELASVIDSWLEDEVLHRQAVALGLDGDDPVIRRYLSNKMRFLVEDSVVVPEPEEADLKSYFETHADTFASDPSYTFTLVSLAGRDEASAIDLLGRLKAGQSPEEAGVSPMTTRFDKASRLDVSRRLGLSFFEQLPALSPGEWQGSLISVQGPQLVRVETVDVPPLPEFEAVRDDVAEAWARTKRDEMEKAAIQRMMDEYDIRREGEPGR